MGNNISIGLSENINQASISRINQACNENAKSFITGVTITAIDSHIGNINLTSTLSVGDMQCVLNGVSSQTIQDVVKNGSAAEINSLPFQWDINSTDLEDSTNISSLQQSVIDQSCIQTATDGVDNVTLTFIDSSTGNITIASNAHIETIACNMKSSSYQVAVANVTDQASSKISADCCLFNAGACVPVILGLAALVIISKIATDKQQRGAVGAEQDQNRIALLQTAAQLKEAEIASKPRPPVMRMDGKNGR